MVLALGGVAGCGGAEKEPTITLDAAGPTSSAPATPRVPKAYQVPQGVPKRSAGRAADAVSRRVITKWLGALSTGNVARAARFFALPSKVQNGTVVLTLSSPTQRAVFNAAFPCGARGTKFERAAGGFTIVDFVLTERPGGNCGGGGGTARSAIRVVDGHIAEWYRLDELPVPGAPAPQPAPGGVPGTQIA